LSPRARHQRRHVTGAAADLREHQGAQHAGRVERRAGRRRQETHERIRGVELRGADLGLGERIHTGRQRLTAHRLLGLVDGIGDAHLHHERIAVELAQRRRGMQLDILAAFLRIVAAAATRNRILVACGAADRVEQRPQPRLRRELGREDGAAHIEPQSLRGREAWQRSAEHGHGRREFRRRQRAWWGRGDGGHRRRCAFIASGDTDQHGYE